MISLYPILLYLPTFINANLYAKTSNLSMDIWNLLEFSKTTGKFKTLIECGSVCEATENCNAFKFDKTTAFCALAKVQLLEVILKNFFFMLTNPKLFLRLLLYRRSNQTSNIRHFTSEQMTSKLCHWFAMEMKIVALKTINVIHIMDIAKQIMIAKVLVTFVVKRIAYHLVSWRWR